MTKHRPRRPPRRAARQAVTVLPAPAELAKLIAAELEKAPRFPAGTVATDVSGQLNQAGYYGEATAAQDRTTGAFAPWPFAPGMPLLPGPIGPYWPDGKPQPRRWEYPVGWNLAGAGQPLTPFRLLRDAADQVDVIRRCLEIRKSEMSILEWDITFHPRVLENLGSEAAGALPSPATGVASAEAIQARMERRLGAKQQIIDQFRPTTERIREFWKVPDRRNEVPFADWLGILLEEYFVVDALSIYPLPARDGTLHSLEILDGTSIKPLLDGRGALPEPPAPAYQQVLYGFPRGEWQASPNDEDASAFAADQLIYRPRHRRSFTPYGYSPVEKALVTADLWMKRQEWLRAEFTDEAVPTMFIKIPETVRWTPEQIRQYEAVTNAELSGQTRERLKLRFLPPGLEPQQLNRLTDMYKPDYDLFLVRLMASHFDVMPTELGFMPSRGLGGAGMQEGEQSCYSADTEVLTDRGWLRFPDVDIDVDRFATRTKTGEFEWQVADRRTDVDFDGELVRFYNSRTLDLLVTGNHRMLCCDAGSHDAEFIVRADEAEHRRWQIPAGSQWCAPDRDVVRFEKGPHRQSRARVYDADDFAAFVGMYLAEGSCWSVPNRRDGTVRVGVSIAQRPESRGFAEYESLLTRMIGHRPYHSGRQFMVTSRVLYDYVKPLGRSWEKYVPRDLLNLSRRQLEVLWRFYWLGDGWSGTNGQPRAATASGRLAGDLQEIAQKIGYAAGITVRAPYGRGRRPMYHLALRKAPAVSYRTERVRYLGTVHCVTVPNGTLYVRRNGQPAWCGNSEYRKGILPLAAWLEDMFTDISRRYLDMPAELQFKFTGLEVEDAAAQANIDKIDIQTGKRTIDEVRAAAGLPLFGTKLTNSPLLVAPAMQVLTDDAEPEPPAPPPPGGSGFPLPPSALPPGPEPAAAPTPDGPPAGRTSTPAVAKELRAFARWAATGKSSRPFRFEVVPASVAERLNVAHAAGVDVRPVVDDLVKSDAGLPGPPSGDDALRTVAHRIDTTSFNLAHARRHMDEAAASMNRLLDQLDGDGRLKGVAAEHAALNAADVTNRYPPGPGAPVVVVPKAAAPRRGRAQTTKLWRWADQIAGAYAPRIGRAMRGVIPNPKGLVDAVRSRAPAAYKAPGDHDAHDLEAIIRAALAQVDPDLGNAQAVLEAVYRDAWLSGVAGARDLLGQALDRPGGYWDTWEPGNWQAALHVLGYDLDGSGLQGMLAQAGITIKSIAQNAQGRLASVLADGIAEGDPTSKIAGAITDELGGNADLIARTEVARAQTAATVETYQNNGVTQKAFLTAEDDDVDDLCAENEDAGPVALGGEFPNGDPPVHPQCLVGSTRVVVPVYVPVGLAGDPSAFGVGFRGEVGSLPASAVAVAQGDFGRGLLRAVTVREFVGEVITVKVAGGYELTGTSNHPVATPHGWVPLAELKVGEDVLCSTSVEWVAASDPDVDHVPSTFEEIAESFPVTFRGVPVTAEDFHGDGAGSDVYEVRAAGPFNSAATTGGAEGGGESELGGRRVPGDFPVEGSGPSAEFIPCDGSSPDGGVGGGGERLSFVGGGSAHPDEHGVASPAGGHAEFFESAADHVAADAEGFCERLLAFSSDVTAAQVIEVNRDAFHGDVFNVDTPLGYYIGNGVITHNCRCVLVPAGFGEPTNADQDATLTSEEDVA